MINEFKFFPQYDQMDCGPACLRMVAYFHGKNYTLQTLRRNSFITREGVSISGIREAAEKIGFDSFSAKISLNKLKEKGALPCILHWKQNHFVVLYDVKKKTGKNVFKIADPGHGIVKLKEESFVHSWLSSRDKGVAIFLNPKEEFFVKEGEKERKITGKLLLEYLLPYKKEVLQLFLGMIIGSLFLLIFPFLTQALIDKGVTPRNLNAIFLILLAQVFLFLGSTIIEVIRNWVSLYIGTRINISIISSFLKKLLNLPIHFFDSKNLGDFNQRIADHKRIEVFLTSESLIMLFSFFNFLIFFIVLFYYDYKILLSYLGLTAISIFWAIAFMRGRKRLDYEKFINNSENQDSVYEIINGIQEIKLNRLEKYKRKKWEDIQIKLFNVNSKILRLDQFQIIGFSFINQIKNILVTFIAAREVVLANITLGEMLSISYIIGQLNSPIDQLISFFRTLQDAKISLGRLNEIQDQEEEEKLVQKENEKRKGKPQYANRSAIIIDDLSFQYGGSNSPFVLKDISTAIPLGKVTAIVGESGSGKTTLMKLLLKFYSPTRGAIHVDGENILSKSPKEWRATCGTVMQDGYIFSDTIERNIASGEEEIDYQRLDNALRIANLKDFVYSIPLKLKTKIGLAGSGLSGGQKQRILIARAVYKNPEFILFDEATSALDAKNEKTIIENLNNFLKEKTAIVIAHRLSTVKNADKIIVLEDGKIIEEGTHLELVSLKGVYFNLIKNQLELSNG